MARYEDKTSITVHRDIREGYRRIKRQTENQLGRAVGWDEFMKGILEEAIEEMRKRDLA